jgi:hypothetical protein
MNTQSILEEVKKEIARLQAVVALLEGDAPASTGKRKRKKRGPMSDESKKKMAAAAKARWAKRKKEEKAA